MNSEPVCGKGLPQAVSAAPELPEELAPLLLPEPLEELLPELPEELLPLELLEPPLPELLEELPLLPDEVPPLLAPELPPLELPPLDAAPLLPAPLLELPLELEDEPVPPPRLELSVAGPEAPQAARASVIRKVPAKPGRRLRISKPL